MTALRMADAPLVLAYGIYPAVALAAGLAGTELNRNWIEGGWVLLAMAALLGLAFRGTTTFRPRTAAALAGALCLLLAVAAARFGWAWFSGPVAVYPFLMELKPLAYAGVAAVWLAWAGPPGRRAFVRWGCLLALVLLLELVVRSLAAGEPTRPLGSGEVNYDGCLLLLSLCAALAGGSRRPGLAAGLLFLGVAAAMSRSALAASAGVFLLCAPASLGVRALLAAGCVAAVWTAFVTRGLDLSHLDRYWMWYSGYRLFSAEPAGLLIGFAPGRPLPAPVPASLEALWTMQSRDWNLWGVYPFHFHSFWLRATATWGAAAPALGAALLAAAAAASRDRMALGLFVVCAAMGMTMGLLYLSNLGPPLLLAIAAALQPANNERGGTTCPASPCSC